MPSWSSSSPVEPVGTNAVVGTTSSAGTVVAAVSYVVAEHADEADAARTAIDRRAGRRARAVTR